jgi:hypothetical protein
MGLIASSIRRTYSLDLNGRVVPHTPADALDPHWATGPFVVVSDSIFFINSIVTAYAAYAKDVVPPAAAPLSTSTSRLRNCLPSRSYLPSMKSVILMVSVFSAHLSSFMKFRFTPHSDSLHQIHSTWASDAAMTLTGSVEISLLQVMVPI